MRRTVSPLVLFVLVAASTIALAMYSTFAPPTEDALAYANALGTGAICLMCAAVVLRVALSFGRREPWRRQWLMVGLGVASYAIGHFVRALHVALGSAVAWMPVPDAFFLAQYLLLCAAFISVAQSYRAITDPRRPALIVAVFGATALAVLWFGLVRPFVLPQSTGVSEALRIALYPAADVLFLAVPGVFVALSLAQLGGMRFARPWYLVAAGGGVLAFADATLMWLVATGAYLPGTLIDFGPIAAELLIASGALAAARLAEEFMVRPHKASTAVAAEAVA